MVYPVKHFSAYEPNGQLMFSLGLTSPPMCNSHHYATTQTKLNRKISYQFDRTLQCHCCVHLLKEFAERISEEWDNWDARNWNLEGMGVFERACRSAQVNKYTFLHSVLQTNNTDLVIIFGLINFKCMNCSIPEYYYLIIINSHISEYVNS